MKFTLKLFCIGLIAAGLTLSACERPAEEEEEATAEETEEVAEEEEEAIDEPGEEEEAAEEEEADAEAEDEEGEDAGEGDEEAEADEEEEGAAADEEPAKAKAPQTPPVVGTVQGAVTGGGIESGTIRVIISKDFTVGGYVRGKREGKGFRVPFQDGSVSKTTDKIVAKGAEGNNRARIDGTVAKGSIAGTLKGKIHGQDFEAKFDIKK
ncbi:MAG: hypothetical protein ACLFVJ_01605 [Persicimonas sp.]